MIRACTPDPGAWTELAGTRVKLWPLASLLSQASPATPADLPELAPGELHVTRGGVYAGAGSGPVLLGDVQPPGKRQMPAADWARGLRGTGAGEAPLGFS